MMVLLLGVLLAFHSLAVRLLSRPMQRLADDLAAMQPGTEARLQAPPDHVHDEIGIVSAAANRLLDLQQQALEREREMRAEIAAMEARYRGIFEATSAGIFVLAGRRLQHGNPALDRLLCSPDGVMPGGWQDNFVQVAAKEPQQLLDLIDAARLAGQPQATDIELNRGDGRAIWAHCLVSVEPGPDGVERVEGVLYDITRRKLAEALAQHRAEHDALTGLKSREFIESTLAQRLQTAAASEEPVALMFLDLDGFKAVNDRWGHAAGDAVLVEAAQRLKDLFRRRADVVGRLGGDELVAVMDGVHATDPMVRELALALIAAFRKPFTLPGGDEARVGVSVGVASYPRHATSAKTLIEAADAAMYAVKQSGKGGFVIASVPETCAEGAAGESALAASPVGPLLTDPLTGLPDRRALPQLLERMGSACQQSGQFGAVLMFDIDQFKLVNLTRGTRSGDEVLCEIARRLERTLRDIDVAVRTGSDEFVILLETGCSTPDVALESALRLAGRLVDAVGVVVHSTQGPINVRASGGITLLPPDATDTQSVLHEAQLALKQAKSSTGTVVAFQPGMMQGLQHAVSLEAELRAALQEGQLELHVQPLVGVRGQMRRGEALLRWNHPHRGWVPPAQFIAMAERSGLIEDIGLWVLRRGCEILALANRDGQPTELSINISPAQFQQRSFVSDVRTAIEAAGARADRLILEITENLLIQQVDDVVLRMQELVDLGVRFSIDDFGTGFSSLAYLRRLPLYEVKIDRSFVSGLPDDNASAGIVQSILAMCRHLGLEVVAEGVETETQSQLLRANQCPYEQGWLHGRPMPVQQWLKLSASRTPATEAVDLSD
jgi:diguanylate cyclase (GGDEF)-like protein